MREDFGVVGDILLQTEHRYYAIAESKLYPYYLCLTEMENFIGYFSREDAEFFEKAAALLWALPEERQS